MMEWYVLVVLMLSLPSWSQADCATRCLRCAQLISDLDSAAERLSCTLECEGAVSSAGTFDRCEKILQQLSDEFVAPKRDAEEKRDDADADAEDLKPVKRYGGFIKRIDKNKNKLFSSPWKENAVLKGLFAKKYGDSLSKLGERDAPSLSEEKEREDLAAQSESAVLDLPLDEVKRYGGFLRKFGPKRSQLDDSDSQQLLQKRYGGFMRRIRPKLRWDNQKRYGGFLRRHFKISVRSDEEEPSSDEDYAL